MRRGVPGAPLPASRRFAAGRIANLEPSPTALSGPIPLGLAATSPWVWWTVSLAILSIVFAAVEHGWKTLSRTRLVDSAAGPRSRNRIERLLKQADAAEDALILLRVAIQVALAMCTVRLVIDLHAGPANDLSSLTAALIWSGASVFVWITLFCRVLPDELGAKTLESMVRGTLPLLVLAARLLAPPVELVRRLIRRVTGHTPEAEQELYEDEILSTVEEGEREGHMTGHQADMIERVLELRETEVHELMTPRTDVDAIDVSVTVGEARDAAEAAGRSRYPLVDGNVDKVVGVVHVKDLLAVGRDVLVRDVARPAWFVPESKYCTELLTEFRDQKTHLAVVLDEYGGTAGIVTIEDVLEEIVGEIEDEFDTDASEDGLQVIDSHHALAMGTIHVDELNDRLGVSIPESDDWSTLGGFIFSTLGRLPDEGEVLKHENVVLEVRSVVDRRAERIAIEILEPAA